MDGACRLFSLAYTITHRPAASVRPPRDRSRPNSGPLSVSCSRSDAVFAKVTNWSTTPAKRTTAPAPLPTGGAAAVLVLTGGAALVLRLRRR